jgi:hypothetical protein
MEGLTPQQAGDPPNVAFWDYAKVTAKTATDVQFTPPLTHNYKSTWPTYGITGWGPAMLQALDVSWPLTVEYNTIISDQTNTGGNGSSIPGQSITFKNVTFIGVLNCGVPSENQFNININVTMTNCQQEVDKSIDVFVMQNTAVHSINFQSAGTKQVVFSELNANDHINGSGINTIMANSTTPSYSPGITSYGGGYGRLYLLGNNLPSIGSSSAGMSNVNTAGTWSGGTFTSSDAMNGALTWAVPGVNVYFNGSSNTTGPVLQVADLTQSGGNTVVSFTQDGSPYAGGFPTMPLNAGAASINVHPAPQLFASGNYGSAQAIDLNQTPPGAPMWSYSKLKLEAANGTYTSPITGPPTVIGDSTYITPVWGELVSVTMTPTTLYTGTALSLDLFTAMVTVNNATARTNFLPSINLKAGLNSTRTILPTSTSGAQSGDSLSSFGAGGWMINNQTGPCWWNGSACATPGGGVGSTSVTFEATTNQHVVNPAQQ